MFCFLYLAEILCFNNSLHPNWRAIFSLSLLTSIPMILFAPNALHPKTADNPMAPNPHMAQVLPSITLATLTALLNPQIALPII